MCARAKPVFGIIKIYINRRRRLHHGWQCNKCVVVAYCVCGSVELGDTTRYEIEWHANYHLLLLGFWDKNKISIAWWIRLWCLLCCGYCLDIAFDLCNETIVQTQLRFVYYSFDLGQVFFFVVRFSFLSFFHFQVGIVAIVNYHHATNRRHTHTHSLILVIIMTKNRRVRRRYGAPNA